MRRLLLILILVGSVLMLTPDGYADIRDAGTFGGAGGESLTSSPGTIAITKDGRFLLAADTADRVRIYDLGNFTLLATVTGLSGTPARVSVTPEPATADATAVVTIGQDTYRSISLAPLSGYRLGSTTPTFTAVTDDPPDVNLIETLTPLTTLSRLSPGTGYFVFVGERTGTSQVLIIDETETAAAASPVATTGAVRKVVRGHDPTGGADDRMVYALSNDSGDLSVQPIAMDSADVISAGTPTTISIADTIFGAAVTDDGASTQTMAVALGPTPGPGAGRLLLLDTSTPDAVNSLGSFGAGTDPRGVAISGANAFVANSGGDSITIRTLATGSPLAESPVNIAGQTPGALAADGFGLVISANAGTNDFSVVTDNPWFLSGGGSVFPATNNGTDDSLIFAVVQDPDFTTTVSSFTPELRKNSGPDQSGSVVSPNGGFIVHNAAGGVDTLTIEAAIPASELTEGDNELWVFIDDAQGNIGRFAFNLIQDLVPQAFDFELSFGDRLLIVVFDALNIDDIDRYEIYFSATRADLEALAPDGANPPGGGLFLALVTNFTPGKKVEAFIDAPDSLPDGTRVYVRLRAIDETGNFGDFTVIKSVVLQEALTLVEASGGGSGGCVSAPRDASSAPAVAAAMVVIPFMIRARRS